MTASESFIRQSKKATILLGKFFLKRQETLHYNKQLRTLFFYLKGRFTLTTLMNWKKLLSYHRLGQKGTPKEMDPARTAFQRDFDRIIFSSSFRRMQDKTQVFPLAETDYVRTRLTHSLEVSSIARSMGTSAGVFICKHFDTAGIDPGNIGTIVAAAALGHDIGNPPLGHGGEESIRDWFLTSPIGKALHDQMSPAEISDIERYEGNAHGFRVMSVLEMPNHIGGMQLTCATLASFAKYPCASLVTEKAPGVAGKKYNFFQTDKELFHEVAEETGLLKIAEDSYCRHPLAFLVEAADDISYRIVDFEDAQMVHLIAYEELERYFLEILGNSPKTKEDVDKIQSKTQKTEFLRAQVIGELVQQVVKVFTEKQTLILEGKMEKALIDCIPARHILQKITTRSINDIYQSPKIATIIAAGFELLSGMLDALVPAVNEIALEKTTRKPASYRAKRMIKVLPASYAPVDDPKWQNSTYLRLLYILDYMAGMTDSFAVSLFKKLKGISL